MSRSEDWFTKPWQFHTMEYYATIKEPGDNHLVTASVGAVAPKLLCDQAGESE